MPDDVVRARGSAINNAIERAIERQRRRDLGVWAGQPTWIENSGPAGSSRLVTLRGTTVELATNETLSIGSGLYDYGARAWCALPEGRLAVLRRPELGLIVLEANGTVQGVVDLPGVAAGYPCATATGCVAVVIDHGDGLGRSLVIVDHEGEVSTVHVTNRFISDLTVDATGEHAAWIEWPSASTLWESGEVWMSTNLEGSWSPRRVDDDRGPCAQPFFVGTAPWWVVEDDQWQHLAHLDGDEIEVEDVPSAEYRPDWVFGRRWHAVCDDRIVHAGVRESHAVILVHDDDGWRRLPGGPRYVYDLAEIDRRVIAIASSSAATSMVWELDIDLGAWRVLVGTNEPERDIEVRRSPGGVPFVWRPAIDGATAPGLVVMIHGGPTAYASLEFDWLSELIRLSGFAVASVDYRGSTSYGRDYRRALLGQWGRADVADVISVIEYLSGSGEVDPGAIFVRGSSAGAMTALLVSTHPLVAGVVTTSGVTELRTLLESTIELERQYTLDLVGGPSMLEERSPFAHVAQMARSMLVMHGVDDEVVPIAQARTFADAARAAGVEVELVEFAGEGHGIRGANNQRAAYRHELDFYARTRQPPERVG